MTAPASPPGLAHEEGAATLRVLGRTTGARRRASVLHAGPDAAYLDVEGGCVGVLSARAVRVPCGIRTSLPVLPALGRDAVVVGGVVELGKADGATLAVTVTDLVDRTVPVLPEDVVDRAGRDLEKLAEGRLDKVRSALPEDALQRLVRGGHTAVRELVGLGPGLTPLGDDVLAGWLATAVARRHPALEVLRAAVSEAAPRTTTLAATLLDCAGHGEVVPELRDLLTALCRADTGATTEALDLLLRIGATSGAGLVLGAVLALQPTPPRPPLRATDEGDAG